MTKDFADATWRPFIRRSIGDYYRLPPDVREEVLALSRARPRRFTPPSQGARRWLGGTLVGSQHTVSGVLITVMFPNGHAIAVPQPTVKGVAFHVGEQVEIVGDAHRVRVLPFK
jgi:hypothetical protein